MFHDARVLLANVTSSADRKMYLEHAKKLNQFSQGRRIIVATCGGDGMLPITLRQFNDNGIDVNKFCFLALPYGSGCDLARTLKWGGDASEDYLKSLKTTIDIIINHTEEGKLNIWECFVTYQDAKTGCI